MSAYEAWTCPFCNAPATQATRAQVSCESRTCACGAVGFAAPACDVDEIMEDATGMFGAAVREDTRGFDAVRQQDVRLSGIEIRHGRTVAVKRRLFAKPLDYTSLWFRR